MNTLWAIVVLLCLLILPGSLVALLFRKQRPKAKWAAGTSAIGLVVSFILFGVTADQSRPHNLATAIEDKAETQPAQLSWKQKLANIRIGGFSWRTDGFGSVMIATFVIYNDNPGPIKDVVVTCVHAANSGTVIDSNKRTLYERIDPKSYFSVRDMNMGFINSKAARSSCKATDFVG
jgi:hypothetical protein